MFKSDKYKKNGILIGLLFGVVLLSFFLIKGLLMNKDVSSLDLSDYLENESEFITKEQKQDEPEKVSVENEYEKEGQGVKNNRIMSNLDSDDPIKLIYDLENILIEYYQFNQENLTMEQIYFINHAIMSIIRSTRYSDYGNNRAAIMWGILAGQTPTELQNLLNELKNIQQSEDYLTGNSEKAIDNMETDSMTNRLLKAIEKVINITTLEHVYKKMEENEEKNYMRTVDFPHMIATTHCLIHKTEMNKDSEYIFDVLAGWGGDLLTFSQELSTHFSNNTTLVEEDLTQFVISTLGTMESSSFNREDFNADIDSVNIAEHLISNNLLLSQGILCYYDSWTTNSMDDFINYYGGPESFNELVRLLINYDTIDQSDIVYHNIEVDTLMGIIMIFHNEFLETKLNDIEKKSLYNGFIYVLRGEYPKQ